MDLCLVAGVIIVILCILIQLYLVPKASIESCSIYACKLLKEECFDYNFPCVGYQLCGCTENSLSLTDSCPYVKACCSARIAPCCIPHYMKCL